MKLRPILFSTEMVEAILSGRKTQTRRIVKPQPIDSIECDGNFFEGNHKGYVKVDGHPNWQKQFAHEFCPYGRPGDILYVREKWKLRSWCYDEHEATFQFADGDQHTAPTADYDATDVIDFIIKEVDWLAAKGIIKPKFGPKEDDLHYYFTDKPQPFKPSIHLPAWASRIWLQITDTHIERLKDITEQDAQSEGVQKNCHYHGDIEKCNGYNGCIHRGKCDGEGEWRNYMNSVDGAPTYSAVDSFKTLWESINSRESLESNPWVWVVKFKVVSTTGKPEGI